MTLREAKSVRGRACCNGGQTDVRGLYVERAEGVREGREAKLLCQPAVGRRRCRETWEEARGAVHQPELQMGYRSAGSATY